MEENIIDLFNYGSLLEILAFIGACMSIMVIGSLLIITFIEMMNNNE